MKIKESEKGAVLIVVLAMILIIVTIMGAGIVFINNGNKRAWSSARSNQALYLAETGIEHAIMQLKDDWSNTVDIYTINFPNDAPIGQYDVTFKSNGEYERTITSTGYVPDKNNIYKSTKKIKCEIKRKKLFSNSIFNNALASDTMMTIHGAAGLTIKGDIYIGGSDDSGTSPYSFKGNPKFDGKITAKDNDVVNKLNQEKQDGSLNTTGIISQQTYEFPNIDEEQKQAFINDSKTGKIWDNNNSSTNYNQTYLVSSDGKIINHYFNGNLIFDGKSDLELNFGDNTIIYIKGTMTVNTNVKITGKVTFIVEASDPTKRDIDFKNNDFLINSTVDPNASISIISLNDITLNTNGNPNISAVILAPNRKIAINGNPNISGAIIAKEIVYGGSAEITYPSEIIHNLPEIYLKEAAIVKWLEE